MYQIVEQVASVDDFLKLRKETGLTPRNYQAAKVALPNSLYGVQIIVNQEVVGMARVVGDGALNFEIVDVAVLPDHQRKGYGNLLMSCVMKYLDTVAGESAYITLMADVPALYEKFGFQLSRPASEGMYIIK